MSFEFDAPARSPTTPGEPRWRLSLAYTVLVTAAVCWVGWPGAMSFDSLFAYEEGLTGIQTMVWPPMHAYMFHLSQLVGAGAGGLFLVQTALLFLPAALTINLMVDRRLWAVAGLVAYALAYLAVPELLGAALVNWRDVTTTSFALLGVAFWVSAARYQRRDLLVWSALSLGLAASLRYNMVLMVAVLGAAMVWRPFLGIAAPRHTRLLTAAALIVAVGLALASDKWRLPDFKPLPAGHNFAGVQAFDLIGISACSDQIYLPPELTRGFPITPAQVRRVYDPRHVGMAFRTVPGQPPILDSDAEGLVEALWPEALREQPACYLSHRASVFREQMGLVPSGVFYPSHGGIDPNHFGLALAHPDLEKRAIDYIYSRQKEPWRRPWIPYLLGALAAAMLCARRSHAGLLAAALVGGGFIYAGVLFFIAPAADARYIFPSTCVTTLAFILAVVALLDRRFPDTA